MSAVPMNDPAANVLVKADGTRMTKSTLTTALGTAETTDPVYRVPSSLGRVYEKGDLPGDPGNPVSVRQVLVPGQLVKSSDIDAMYPAPTITTITPATGLAAGGLSVTIKGTNFKHTGTSVTFGGTAATSVVVVDKSTITCTTPAKTAGAYNVVVTTDSGTGTKTNGFTYS
jgi:hypothetical protein